MIFLFLLKLFCQLSLTEEEKNSIAKYKSLVPFMNISYNSNGQRLNSKIRFQLFFDEVPKTALNFAKILEGTTVENGIKAAYKKTIFHRIIPGFMMQGGDFTNHNGTGGKSIYGHKFDDENFGIKHAKGVLSMANSGKNTNGSQFFITFDQTSWLNGAHVVFGKVLDSDLILLKNFENVERNRSDKPIHDVIVEDCGFEHAIKSHL